MYILGHFESSCFSFYSIRDFQWKSGHSTTWRHYGLMLMCWHTWFDYPCVVFLIAGLIPGNNSLIEQIQYYTACILYIMDYANILLRIMIPAWYCSCSPLEDLVVTKSQKCGNLIFLSARIRFRTNESSNPRSQKIWRWCDDNMARNPNILFLAEYRMSSLLCATGSQYLNQ